MHENLKIVCVIPGRLGSKRFPRKMLAVLGDKPLIQWAWEGAMNTPLFDEVVVAVDSEELKGVVEGFGGRSILTAPSCSNGTERLLELYQRKELTGDIWVNWQGDEPFITGDVIKTLLQTCSEEGQEIWTLKKKISEVEQIASPHVVKVVTDGQGRALYFSRSPIPYGERDLIFQHVGLYAYAASALEKMGSLAPAPLERAENLEQLRFLYHGLSIQVHETDKKIFGIDTEEELEIAQQFVPCYNSSDHGN